MPRIAHHSSSAGFALFAHPQLASRSYSQQLHTVSLTERPNGGVRAASVAGSKGGHAPALRGVVPDKGSLARALKASDEPGPVVAGQSPTAVCSTCHRAQARSLPPVKLIHTTSWLDPRVRAELQREATNRHLSLSEVVALACRDWVRYEIHRQQTSLFETKQRHIIREEIQRLKDSLIPFEIKTATASEHTRILVTDVYKRILKADGVPIERFYEILDEADEMATNNIKARSPKFSALVNAWETPKTATPQTQQAGKGEPN